MKSWVASSLLKLRVSRHNKQHLPLLQPALCGETSRHV